MTKKEMIQKRVLGVLRTGNKTDKWLKTECSDMASRRTIGRAITDLVDNKQIKAGKNNDFMLMGDSYVKEEKTQSTDAKTQSTPAPESQEAADMSKKEKTEDNTSMPLKERMKLMGDFQKRGMSGAEAKTAVENIVCGKSTIEDVLTDLPEIESTETQSAVEISKTDQIIMKGRFLTLGATEEEADNLVKDIVAGKITEDEAVKDLYDTPESEPRDKTPEQKLAGFEDKEEKEHTKKDDNWGRSQSTPKKETPKKAIEKSKKSKRTKPAGKKTKPQSTAKPKTKKPGIIKTIRNMVVEKGPISKRDIHKALIKMFPDKKEKSLWSTVSCQIPSKTNKEADFNVIRTEKGWIVDDGKTKPYRKPRRTTKPKKKVNPHIKKIDDMVKDGITDEKVLYKEAMKMAKQSIKAHLELVKQK